MGGEGSTSRSASPAAASSPPSASATISGVSSWSRVEAISVSASPSSPIQSATRERPRPPLPIHALTRPPVSAGWTAGPSWAAARRSGPPPLPGPSCTGTAGRLA
ncbi:MAG: hypothetical protein QM767_27425 [Anaeromyxobacter sp.]